MNCFTEAAWAEQAQTCFSYAAHAPCAAPTLVHTGRGGPRRRQEQLKTADGSCCWKVSCLSGCESAAKGNETGNTAVCVETLNTAGLKHLHEDFTRL